jgi:hypothetical protein
MRFDHTRRIERSGVMVVRRIHKSTLIACLIGSLLLIIASIPGRVIEWQPHSFTTYEHGWPFVYLKRRTIEPHPSYFHPITFSFRRDAISELPSWGVPWLTVDNWMLWESGEYEDDSARWRFSVAAFALDVLVAGALLTAVVAGCEMRRRRQRGVFAFNLRDMFAAVAIISLVCGWHVYAMHEYRRELPFAERGWSDPDSGYGVYDEVCIAPDFVRALVGDKLMPDFFWRVSTVAIESDLVDDPDKLCDELAAFSYLRTICIDYWEEEIHVPFSALRSLKALQRIEIDNSQYVFDKEDIRELSKLTELEEIAFWSLDEVQPELILQLQAALPECRIVDAYDVW